MELKALPERVEKRLADLVEMEEFDMEEVGYCRQTYWEDRDGWHQTLVNCFDRAQQRIADEKLAARDALAMIGAGV